MAQEIFAFMQSHLQSGTNLFGLLQEQSKENSQGNSVFFDTLINEFTSENVEAGQALLNPPEKNLNVNVNPPVMNFRSEKSFSWPIINVNNNDDVIEAKTEKILPQKSDIVFYDEEQEIKNNIPEIKDVKQPVDVKVDEAENFTEPSKIDVPLDFPELEKLPEKIQSIVKNFVAEIETEFENINPEIKDIKQPVDVKVDEAENFAEPSKIDVPLDFSELEKLPEKIQSLIKNFVAEIETEFENINPEIKDIKQPVDVKIETHKNFVEPSKIDLPVEFPELEKLPQKIQSLIKNFVAEIEVEVENINPEIKDVNQPVEAKPVELKFEKAENFVEPSKIDVPLDFKDIKDLPQKIQSIIKNFVAEVETEAENFNPEIKQKIINLISTFKNDNSKPVNNNVDVVVNKTANEFDTKKIPVENNEPLELPKKNLSVKIALKNFVAELKTEFQNDKPDINQPVINLISALTKNNSDVDIENNEINVEAPENNFKSANKITVKIDTPVKIEQPQQNLLSDDDKEFSEKDTNVNVENFAGVTVNIPDVNFEVKPQIKTSENSTENQNQRVSFEHEKISLEIPEKLTSTPTQQNSKSKSEVNNSKDFSSNVEFEIDNDDKKISREILADNNLTENHDNENNSQNFNQPRENLNENSSTPQNFSRPQNRNNERKISSPVSEDENSFTASSTRKTDSHNTFQNFFEGILNNRKTVSRRSPLPLNIRNEGYNFNRSETLRNGLVNVVRFIRADGVQKASVVIDPPALGRISVELTSNSSGVEASIKVASEQIRQIVQDQLIQLRDNLSQQGVQVSEFTVDVQQDNRHGGGNYQGDNQRRQNFAFNGIDEEDTEEFRIDIEEGLLYWVA